MIYPIQIFSDWQYKHEITAERQINNIPVISILFYVIDNFAMWLKLLEKIDIDSPKLCKCPTWNIDMIQIYSRESNCINLIKVNKCFIWHVFYNFVDPTYPPKLSKIIGFGKIWLVSGINSIWIYWIRNAVAKYLLIFRYVLICAVCFWERIFIRNLSNVFVFLYVFFSYSWRDYYFFFFNIFFKLWLFLHR